MDWELYIEKKNLNLQFMGEWLYIVNEFKKAIETKGFFDISDLKNLIKNGSDFERTQNIIGSLMSENFVSCLFTDSEGRVVDPKEAYEKLNEIGSYNRNFCVEDYLNWLESFSVKWFLI